VNKSVNRSSEILLRSGCPIAFQTEDGMSP
jgi:hypothetical protein